MLGGAHIPEDELYAYVLGEGDAKSRAEFREHLRTCPQCSSEAAETQLALSALSLALPEAEPDLSVRRRVMQEISPAAGTNREARATFFGWRWAFGLAACAAVVFAVMAGGAWQRNHNLAAQLQDAQARNAGLQAAQAESANNSARAVAVLSALTAADTAKFVLTRADARPEPQVRAYYRRSTGQVLLTAAALPAAAERQGLRTLAAGRKISASGRHFHAGCERGREPHGHFPAARSAGKGLWRHDRGRRRVTCSDAAGPVCLEVIDPLLTAPKREAQSAARR